MEALEDDSPVADVEETDAYERLEVDLKKLSDSLVGDVDDGD